MTEDWEFTQREAARSMLANYKLGIADSWIKAMTELVTNSHQNYHDMIDNPEYTVSEKPTIVIYANGVDETFTVLDHGTGIAGSGKELQELLMDYSAYIKKSHTPKGRSSFGRGMSDVLFRRKEYVNSLLAIKNGTCIAAKAHWTDKGPTFSNDTATTEKQIRAELGEHGTAVTFHWDSNIEPKQLEIISKTFNSTFSAYVEKFGKNRLIKANEINTIRAPLYFEDEIFISLATNKNLLKLLAQLIDGKFILNQQNGIINPPCKSYNQGSWHRDFPYQHFISDTPLGINALFCIDEFKVENGSTFVLPKYLQGRTLAF